MIPMILRLDAEGSPLPCGLCGGDLTLARGPHLCVDETSEPVCRSCGKQHAPALAALLELAHAAEYVGRIGRHTVSPPLTALLDLARAAEGYAAALPPPPRCQAA